MIEFGRIFYKDKNIYWISLSSICHITGNIVSLSVKVLRKLIIIR
jgi:hypothetical protein